MYNFEVVKLSKHFQHTVSIQIGEILVEALLFD